jgi:hypothetical protein
MAGYVPKLRLHKVSYRRGSKARCRRFYDKVVGANSIKLKNSFLSLELKAGIKFLWGNFEEPTLRVQSPFAPWDAKSRGSVIFMHRLPALPVRLRRGRRV